MPDVVYLVVIISPAARFSGGVAQMVSHAACNSNVELFSTDLQAGLIVLTYRLFSLV